MMMITRMTRFHFHAPKLDSDTHVITHILHEREEDGARKSQQSSRGERKTSPETMSKALIP
jgi:hypothetical protein